MALSSFSDLVIQVPLWLNRPGDPKITGSVPDWISLCEQRIAYGASESSQFPSRPLRIRAMETTIPSVIGAVQAALTVTGTANIISITISTSPASYAVGLTVSFAAAFTNTGPTTLNVNGLGVVNVLKGSALLALAAGDIVGGATSTCYYDGTQFVLMPGSATMPLPSNYLSMREIYLDTNPRDYLDYVVPDEMNRLYPWSMGQKPVAYTVEGDAIRFGPPPDATYYCFVEYYKKFPALATATTNWLMTNAPGVYLYGTLLESAPFIGQDSRLPLWHGMYLAACDGLAESDQDDRHSGTLLTMRPQHWSP